MKNQIENLRDEVESDFNLDVKIVESNMHTYLFTVNKKKGDLVNFLLRFSDNTKISFNKFQLRMLISISHVID